MKGRILSLFGFALLAAAGPEQAVRDWRVDLLKAEGIGLSREALEKQLKGGGEKLPELEKIVSQLGAETLVEREAAQKELLKGGEETLKWLKRREPSGDPEVQMRVERVMVLLGSTHRKTRESAVEHAVKTLLAEGDERKQNTGGLFYEWFGEEADTLGEGYRQFSFESEFDDKVGREGSVERGTLKLPGAKLSEGDQRLVLRSKDWPGEASFGESFEVSAELGGESKGVGAWHLGISIGKVRVLFHPGLAGGAFRFEIAGKGRFQGPNADTGFTPGEKALQWISVTVNRLPDERVQLKVILEEGGGGKGRYQTERVFEREEIGDLDRVSLDRSGRAGGVASFRNLTVRIF